MAVDKLVDSTQLDSDLTSVANAIRTKGGTSASLAFPAGFVSAVQAIPTGGGASLQSGTFTLATNGKNVSLELEDASFTHFFAYDGNPTAPDPTAGGWKTTTMLYVPDVGLSKSMAVYTSGTYYNSMNLVVSVNGNTISFTTQYNMIAGDEFTWFAW